MIFTQDNINYFISTLQSKNTNAPIINVDINFQELDLQNKHNLLIESINSCQFYSMDLEMTGISLNQEEEHSEFDFPQLRYEKMKRVVEEYDVVQMGISFFLPKEKISDRTKDKEDPIIEEVYLERTFVFYLFKNSPLLNLNMNMNVIDIEVKENYKTINNIINTNNKCNSNNNDSLNSNNSTISLLSSSIKCNPNTLKFLIKENFDFNIWVRKGIHYNKLYYQKQIKTIIEKNLEINKQNTNTSIIQFSKGAQRKISALVKEILLFLFFSTEVIEERKIKKEIKTNSKDTRRLEIDTGDETYCSYICKINFQKFFNLKKFNVSRVKNSKSLIIVEISVARIPVEEFLNSKIMFETEDDGYTSSNNKFSKNNDENRSKTVDSSDAVRFDDDKKVIGISNSIDIDNKGVKYKDNVNCELGLVEKSNNNNNITNINSNNTNINTIINNNTLKNLINKNGVLDSTSPLFSDHTLVSSLSVKEKLYFYYLNREKDSFLHQLQDVITFDKIDNFKNKYLFNISNTSLNDKASLSTTLLNQELGFSLIIQELINSKKPMIGHNMTYDLMFIYNKFISDLPSNFTEYIQELNSLFPYILDTKILSFYSGKINFSKLKELYTTCVKLKYNNYVNIVSDTLNGFTLYETNDEKNHDAGYDARQTGRCFVYMSKAFENCFIISDKKQFNNRVIGNSDKNDNGNKNGWINKFFEEEMFKNIMVYNAVKDGILFSWNYNCEVVLNENEFIVLWEKVAQENIENDNIKEEEDKKDTKDNIKEDEDKKGIAKDTNTELMLNNKIEEEDVDKAISIPIKNVNNTENIDNKESISKISSITNTNSNTNTLITQYLSKYKELIYKFNNEHNFIDNYNKTSIFPLYINLNIIKQEQVILDLFNNQILIISFKSTIIEDKSNLKITRDLTNHEMGSKLTNEKYSFLIFKIAKNLAYVKVVNKILTDTIIEIKDYLLFTISDIEYILEYREFYIKYKEIIKFK